MAKSDKTYTWVTSTGTPTVSSTSSSTASGSFTVTTGQYYTHEENLSDIEKAVYAHIQAVRTLGREQINTQEIAQALALPQESVIAAVARLRSKGVRVAA